MVDELTELSGLYRTSNLLIVVEVLLRVLVDGMEGRCRGMTKFERLWVADSMKRLGVSSRKVRIAREFVRAMQGEVAIKAAAWRPDRDEKGGV